MRTKTDRPRGTCALHCTACTAIPCLISASQPVTQSLTQSLRQICPVSPRQADRGWAHPPGTTTVATGTTVMAAVLAGRQAGPARTRQTSLLCNCWTRLAQRAGLRMSRVLSRPGGTVLVRGIGGIEGFDAIVAAGTGGTSYCRRYFALSIHPSQSTRFPGYILSRPVTWLVTRYGTVHPSCTVPEARPKGALD